MSSACPFDSTLPDDAVLLCAANADCPAPWTCDTSVHECVAPGATPDRAAPVLQSAAFTPSVVAAGSVELVLTADEPLGEPPTLLFEGSGDPGFVPLDVVGAVARFSLDAGAVAAGAWPLGSVELVDLHGNRATRLTPDLALVIDRRAPVILDVAVAHADAAAAGLPFSTNPGTNQMVVSFVVDEAVAASAVQVQAGPVSATCVLGDANTFTCNAQVTAAFTDGRDRVLVTVTDQAGNRGEASADLETDQRAPQVIDVVTVLRSPASAAPVGAAVAGGTIELELILDEPLGAPPTFTLIGDVAVVDPLVEELTPLRWRWRASVALVGAAGQATMGVALHDRVGNAAVLDVTTVPLALAVLSPCAPLDDTADCLDFDGDGDFAITARCGVRGGDCDDTDPLTRTDGSEIPGDGIDNDCAGDGDAPLDESTGVFVDPAAAVGGSGTRAAPVRSIDEARALLAGRGWLFLAEATGTTYPTSGNLNVSLVGGLTSAWARVPAARSRVSVAGLSIQQDGTELVVIDGVTLVNVNLPSVPVVADVRLSLRRSASPWPLIATRRFLASDGEVRPLEIGPGVTGSLISHSIINEGIVLGDGSDLLIVASDADDVADAKPGPDMRAGAGARLEIISSLVPPIACNGCTLRVTHSVLATAESDITALIDVVGSPVNVELRNNIFFWPDGDAGDTCVRNDNGRVLALANLFFAPFAGALLLSDSTFSATNVDVINACGPPDCVDGDRNLSGDPRFSAERAHLELSSPAVGAAAVAYQGLPASVAVDIDGECRTAIAPEIGADEK